MPRTDLHEGIRSARQRSAIVDGGAAHSPSSSHQGRGREWLTTRRRVACGFSSRTCHIVSRMG